MSREKNRKNLMNNTKNTNFIKLKNKKKSKKIWFKKPLKLNLTYPSISVLMLLMKIEIKPSKMFVEL